MLTMWVCMWCIIDNCLYVYRCLLTNHLNGEAAKLCLATVTAETTV